MIARLYLKHAFTLSDEALVERWSDSPNFQYFSGQAYFEPRLPCDATTLVKFRRLPGEEGCEELLAQTINQTVSMKPIPLQHWPPWWSTAPYKRRSSHTLMTRAGVLSR